jgi:ABC-type amino acid transport substrate-binding protein
MTATQAQLIAASPRCRVHASLTARIAATLLLLLLFPVSMFGQTALQRVRQSGELRVGTDATYPPFETVEGEQFSGFDIDLINAVAREMGVRARFINASFDGIFPALQNGTFDAVISSVTITQERKASMLFTDPYYDSGQLISVREETQGISTPDDLKGKTVGVQINTTAQYDLEKRAGVTVNKYNTIDLALLDLQNKRIDAVVCDAPVLKYMIFKSFRGLKTVGRRFTDEKFGIAVAQGNEDLVSEINAALKRIRG